MECPITSGRDLAEGYVAGTLSEAEQDAFEQHFFTCSACLAHVQMLQEVKDGLRRLPAAIPGHRPVSAGWATTPWLGLALAAGLVAAIGWWWQGGAGPARTPPTVAVGPAATPNPAPTPAVPGPAPAAPNAAPPVEAPPRRAVLAQLALVVAPRYVPIAVRGDGPPAGSFDAAMAHYVAGRHREAAAALGTLSAEQPGDPGIAFFWGISELVLGHPEPARQELRYAVSHEAGPEGEAARILAALDRLPR